MKKYTFFWGGPFSQWAPSEILIDGVRYNSCEQYMMAQKALVFNDMESHDAIMKAQHPSQQKALGRKIKNFDKETWEIVAKDVVYRANYAKFTQHKHYYDDLMATGDTLLVEASPEDKIWGIGLAESDPRVHDESKWQGTNWLGEIITDVRNDLRNEKSQWNELIKNPKSFL
jgi:ribA/ribD-fused uncharacterized protein